MLIGVGRFIGTVDSRSPDDAPITCVWKGKRALTTFRVRLSSAIKTVREKAVWRQGLSHRPFTKNHVVRGRKLRRLFRRGRVRGR